MLSERSMDTHTHAHNAGVRTSHLKVPGVMMKKSSASVWNSRPVRAMRFTFLSNSSWLWTIAWVITQPQHAANRTRGKYHRPLGQHKLHQPTECFSCRSCGSCTLVRRPTTRTLFFRLPFSTPFTTSRNECTSSLQNKMSAFM